MATVLVVPGRVACGPMTSLTIPSLTMTSRPRRVGFGLALIVGLLAALAGPAVASNSSNTTAPPNTPQIIGGHKVDVSQYPYQAALIDLTRQGNDWDRQICGGRLIAPTWVLTAAHCVHEAGVTTTPDQLEILLGRTNLFHQDGERHSVRAIYYSHRFSEVTDSDDVALVQLDTPSAYPPIAIADAAQNIYELPGTMLTVVGWGDVNAQPPLVDPTNLHYPRALRAVKVPVVADRTCKDAYGAVGDIIIASTTVCAGAAGLDACYGDSGGPLLATTPSGPVEIGIVASGEGCGAPGFPGTYTEVNAKSVRNFIVRTMADHP